MLKENCRIGTKVVFGRPNGEKTVGEVVGISETKAHIKTLESRGDGNRGGKEHRTKIKPAGTLWQATLDIVEPLEKTMLEALHSLPPKDENLLDYLERGSETLCGCGDPPRFFGLGWDCMGSDEQNAILQAISSNYRHRRLFSKTVPSSWSQKGLDELNRRLGLLFEALGRPVSESVCLAWEDDQRTRRARPREDDQRIRREILEEFSDPTDRIKAIRHWTGILEELPDDRDHRERILRWNARRVSPAWVNSGLPRIPPWLKTRNAPQGRAV